MAIAISVPSSGAATLVQAFKLVATTSTAVMLIASSGTDSASAIPTDKIDESFWASDAKITPGLHDRVLKERHMRLAKSDLLPRLRGLPDFHSLHLGKRGNDPCLYAVLTDYSFDGVERAFELLNTFKDGIPSDPFLDIDVLLSEDLNSHSLGGMEEISL